MSKGEFYEYNNERLLGYSYGDWDCGIRGGCDLRICGVDQGIHPRRKEPEAMSLINDKPIRSPLVAMLRAVGIEYLRFEKLCVLVMTERSPLYMLGVPDIIGIKPNGYLIEVEIKISKADFYADSKKIKNASGCDLRKPYQHYFLVPLELERSLNEWPYPNSGLLVFSGERVACSKPAPIKHDGLKIEKPQDWKRAFRLQTNEIVSVYRQNYKMAVELQNLRTKNA